MIPPQINGAVYRGIQTYNPADPGAGNSLVWSPSAGVVVKLVGIACKFTWGAGVANRKFRMTVYTPPGAPAATILAWQFCTGTLIATNSARVWMHESLQQTALLTQAASGGFVAESHYIYGPVPLLYLDARSGGNAADRLAIQPLGIQAADTLTEILIQCHVWQRAT